MRPTLLLSLRLTRAATNGSGLFLALGDLFGGAESTLADRAPWREG